MPSSSTNKTKKRLWKAACRNCPAWFTTTKSVRKPSVIERLQSIAAHIAKALGADAAAAERAARLAKADLVTEMVGEFPELQGTMGKYYARLDGETEEIAEAIEQHYQPRFAGDNLPNGKVATAVALADKLETLVGIWGIGLIPTGDKDPSRPAPLRIGYFAYADAIRFGRKRTDSDGL